MEENMKTLLGKVIPVIMFAVSLMCFSYGCWQVKMNFGDFLLTATVSLFAIYGLGCIVAESVFDHNYSNTGWNVDDFFLNAAFAGIWAIGGASSINSIPSLVKGVALAGVFCLAAVFQYKHYVKQHYRRE